MLVVTHAVVDAGKTGAVFAIGVDGKRKVVELRQPDLQRITIGLRPSQARRSRPSATGFCA
ncbi:MAG: hypothetical protein LJE92_14915 [Gammaproteobacteria bacterium]|jgi:hypothetical protein|nr:hypothetical protein [Gammaproteobacteria bacterium]